MIKAYQCYGYLEIILRNKLLKIPSSSPTTKKTMKSYKHRYRVRKMKENSKKTTLDQFINFICPSVLKSASNICKNILILER